MAEDDEWDEDEGKWTRRSKDAQAQDEDSTRYFELPSGEVVEGPPPDDVPAEPVEPPEDVDEDEDEDDEGGIGLFGGDEPEDEPPEPAEEPEEVEDDEGSKAPLIVGVVIIILLVGLIAVVGAAYLNIADPLGIGDALGAGDDGTTGATDGNGDGNGGGGGNETPTMFEYPVNWSTSNFTVNEHDSGNVAAGGGATSTFNLSRNNLTGVTFTLRFTDDDEVAAGQNEDDTLQMNVTSPGGETKQNSGSGSGSDEVSFDVTFEYASVPSSPTSVTAETRDNATRALLAQQPVQTNGTGEYTIEIAFTDGGSTCVRGGAGGVGGNSGDCSDDWVLDVSYDWYTGVLGEGTEVES